MRAGQLGTHRRQVVEIRGHGCGGDPELTCRHEGHALAVYAIDSTGRRIPGGTICVDAREVALLDDPVQDA